MVQGHFLQGHFLRHKSFFFIIFFYYCVFKMKSNNFLVESFLIGLGLVIGLAMMLLD